MKLKKQIICLLCIFPLFCGCEDFLNIKDEGAISPAIWNSESSAQLYVNKIYSMCMPSFGSHKVYGDISASDCTDETYELGNLLIGTMEPNSVGAYSADKYQAIRFINIALEELKSSKMSPDAYKRIAGQLYFFRAYQHWTMVLIHGGVPYSMNIVDYNTSGELKNLPRNKTSECIQYIKEDMQKAIDMLPVEWKGDSWGHISSAAAAGMLGRILLFYASPQFTPDQASEVARQRWQEAYEANQKAIEICKGKYGLLNCTTAPSEQWPTNADINKIFIDQTDSNIELLLFKAYNSASQYHTYENSVRPEKQTNASLSSFLPTLKLVKAFPNANGTPYDQDDTYPYYWKDRDSRFYSTIVYNGAYLPYYGSSTFRLWAYNQAYPDIKNYSTTGFYCRKMLNSSTSNFTKTGTYWVELRYAEVLLNLAEAALMTNHEDVTYDCLGQIRKRAGIPEGDHFYGLKDNDWTLFELVMNERLIELAFEGKRFHDLRRWNMFTTDYGTHTLKLNGQKKAGWGLKFTPTNQTEFEKNRDSYTMEEVTAKLKIAKKTVLPSAKKLNYVCYPDETSLKEVNTGSYNFFDLPDGIITRSPAIKQTMGWPYDSERGCFNPFE